MQQHILGINVNDAIQTGHIHLQRLSLIVSTNGTVRIVVATAGTIEGDHLARSSVLQEMVKLFTDSCNILLVLIPSLWSWRSNVLLAFQAAPVEEHPCHIAEISNEESGNRMFKDERLDHLRPKVLYMEKSFLVNALELRRHIARILRKRKKANEKISLIVPGSPTQRIHPYTCIVYAQNLFLYVPLAFL